MSFRFSTNSFHERVLEKRQVWCLIRGEIKSPTWLKSLKGKELLFNDSKEFPKPDWPSLPKFIGRPHLYVEKALLSRGTSDRRYDHVWVEKNTLIETRIMIKSWVTPGTGDRPLQHKLLHPLHCEPLCVRPIHPYTVSLPRCQLHMPDPHIPTILYPQVDRPPAQCVEVELKVEVRAVGEDDVQLAVQPGRSCQRPLHKVQVARVGWLEWATGAHNLSGGVRLKIKSRTREGKNRKKGKIYDCGRSPRPLLSQAPDLTRWSTCIEAGATRPEAGKWSAAKITTSRHF